MKLQGQKQAHLLSLLQGWILMDISFPDSTNDYILNKKMKYSQNLESIDKMIHDSKLSFEQFTNKVDILL
jgi:hypothetical protein